MLLDFPTLLSADCLAGGGESALYMVGALFPVIFIVALWFAASTSQSYRRMWKKTGDEAAAARAAQRSNFGWALFTLGSPPVMAGIMTLFEKTTRGVDGFILAASLATPIWLLIPRVALLDMKEGQASGVLHTREFAARYGWLCSRCASLTKQTPILQAPRPYRTPTSPQRFAYMYISHCDSVHNDRYRDDGIGFAWDLIVLEVRFATIAVGVFIQDPVTAASICAAITLGLLIMQAKYRPFLETAEQANHWAAPNKMGVLGFVSQLVVLFVGIVSIVAKPTGALALMLTIIAVIAVLVPLTVTIVILWTKVDLKRYFIKGSGVAAAVASASVFEDAGGEGNPAAQDLVA